MHTNSRHRRPVSPGRQPSLLGTYPLPVLHLASTPIPPDPGLPSQWQPAPPPLQYGIDYTFTQRVGRQPVRWQTGSSITVRIAGTNSRDERTALAKVVAELRALTQLDLVTGEPLPANADPAAVPAREIHVGYLPAHRLAASFARCAGKAGLGGATSCADGSCYVSGFAIVNADLTEPDATGGQALAILRHQLGHALGLGHSTRRGLLMHYQIATDTTQYGRGDRYGLTLLGQVPPSGITLSSDYPRIRTLPCAV